MTSAVPTMSGTFPHDCRLAAELYIGRGLAPIPLPPRSKGPVIDRWPSLRLTPADLDRHFRSEPGNIGILNGEPSGNVLDVDLDCTEARLSAPLLLPETGWIFGRASAPGSHWIYRTDWPLDTPREEYGDIAGSVLVEMRGTGGQTVYPPSMHTETGEQITWERFGDATRVKLSELRRAVRELAACSLLARHWPAKGSRQDAFLALIGGLLRANWEQERLKRFINALVIATNDEEVRKRIQSVADSVGRAQDDRAIYGWPKLEQLLGKAGKQLVGRIREWMGIVYKATPDVTTTKKVRTPIPYVPFPVEALPEPIRSYVTQGARALGCDPAYLALPALTAAASLIGNTRVIRLKRTWDEPSIVWTTIVGDSGTLKSPAFKLSVRHLYAVQERLLDEFRVAMEHWKDEMEDWKDADPEDRGEKPTKPVLKKVVCSDTTIEKLAQILEDNPRGTLVARDELAGWLGSFSRYKGKNGGTDLPNWLEMHTAGTVMVDRKTGERPTVYVRRAAASVTGGIQPGVLARAFTAEFLDSGLAARLLIAMPPKVKKLWSEMEIDPATESAYHILLDRLHGLEFDASGDESGPHVLRLTPDAKTAWVAFYNVWAAEQAAVEGELAAAFSKLEAYAARFALLHHVTTHVGLDSSDLRPIGVQSIEAGITLCRWFAGEARRVYQTLSESDSERDVRRLVEWISARKGKTTAKDLQNSNSRKYPDAETATEALDALVAAGYGEWVDRPTDSRGGRPTRDFVLFPTTDDTDETPPTNEDDGGKPPSQPPDDSGAPPTNTPQNSGASGESSVSSDGLVDSPVESTFHGDWAAPMGEDGVSSESASGSPGPAFALVTSPSDLPTVASAVEESAVVGLDLETTGLDPRTDRIRLLSVSVDTVEGTRFSYLIDCFAVDPTPLFPALNAAALVVHNAAFDLGFLGRVGFIPGRVADTMLLSQLLYASARTRGVAPTRHGLKDCCAREMGVDLAKDLQASNWAGQLSAEQITYAASDVVVLAPLVKVLTEKLKAAGLERAAAIESAALPSIVWMSQAGVLFDRNRWTELAATATEEAGRLAIELDAVAPPKPGSLFGETWNWDSPEQVKEALVVAGCKVNSTRDHALATLDHPLARLLRDHRDARKRETTYGVGWLKHVATDGRVYPRWVQLGANSGRMACGSPNMQNLPRGQHRNCVIAPPGRVLVKADYSQIELRIAAKVSGDKALAAAYQRGDDLHTLTARSVLGVTDVTKEHRQLAKAINFGLLYGMGAKGFRDYAGANYGLDLTEEQAGQYRAAFFRTYPGLRRWHRSIRDGASDTRTLAGRRVLGVERFNEKLNLPVQGTGADGLKLALGLLWERRAECPSAVPVLAVHDEIVVECNTDDVEGVKAWLTRAMVDAMTPLITPIPVEVAVKVSATWGGD